MPANLLRRYRLQAGLTVAELARRSGVAVRTIQRIEGEDEIHREVTLRKLYNALKSEETLNQTLTSFSDVFPGSDD